MICVLHAPLIAVALAERNGNNMRNYYMGYFSNKDVDMSLKIIMYTLLYQQKQNIAFSSPLFPLSLGEQPTQRS